MEDIVLNVTFEGDANNSPEEIFVLPHLTKWMDLEAMLQAQFDCKNIKVHYIDKDGDYIVLSSQDELIEAFKVAECLSNTLHIVVRDLGSEVDPKSADFQPVITEEPKPSPIIAPVDTRPEHEKETNLTDDGKTVQTVEGETTNTDDGKMKEKKDQQEAGLVIDDATGELLAATGANPLIQISPKKIEGLEKSVIAETGEINTAQNQSTKEHVKDGKKKKSKESSTHSRPRKLQEPTRIEIERGVSAFDLKNGLDKAEKKRKSDTHGPHTVADQGARPKRPSHDKESGEMAPDEVAMPYSVFVKFMQQLKCDLRTEIVKDVTRKTVRHVLKGLDGAVIKQGKECVPEITKPLGGLVAATKSSDPSATHPVYYHEGVVCSFCERSIIGVRYKCCNCVSYDLCEECENIFGVHDKDHTFIKIRRPCKMLKNKPLLKSSIYHRQKEVISPEEGPADSLKVLKVKGDRSREKSFKKQEKMKKKEEKILQKQRKRDEILKRRMDGHGEEPFKRERLDTPDQNNDLMDMSNMSAEFISDVSIPEGTCVQPGTKLTKTWGLRNTGWLPWNSQTSLQMLHSSFPVVDESLKTNIDSLKPGEEGYVSVEIIAPEEPGEYKCNWKLKSGDMTFGPHLWCHIKVLPKETLEPTKEDPLKLLCPVPEQEHNDNENEDTECVPPISVNVVSPVEVDIKISSEKELKRVDDLDEVKVICNNEDVSLSDILKGERQQEEPESVTIEILEAEPEDREETELSTAAAAIALLSQDHGVDKQTIEDFSSYDLLEGQSSLELKSAPKVSQTATPNNTPLDITPPKSPAAETEEFCQLSRESSVELVNAEESSDQVAMNSQYVQDILSKLQTPQPDGVEADLESLQSYTDDDESSVSEDDDFIIVPMPACFDFSKPITRAMVENLSDDEDDSSDAEFLDDNHNNLSPSRNRTADEILKTSESVPTEVLEPEPVVEAEPVVFDHQTSPQQSLPEDAIPRADSTSSNEESSASVTPQEEASCPVNSNTAPSFDPDETAVMTVYSSAGAAAAAGSCPDDMTSSNADHNGGSSVGSHDSDQGEATRAGSDVVVEQLQSATSGVAANHQSEDSEGGATGESQGQRSHMRDENRPSELFVNQMMATAVKAANKAAANAYTTAKEVFFTWQARAYQHRSGQMNQGNKWKPPQSNWTPSAENDSDGKTNQSQYKPPKSSWKPAEDNYKPPTSTWKPKAEEWKPKADSWQPKSDNWSPPRCSWKPSDSAAKKEDEKEGGEMQRLFEMGFCNREKNKKLLEEHDSNIETVIQILLSESQNDWMENRH